MTTPLPVTDDDLHAYVDGRLDAEHRAAVEAWLAANPDRAAEIAHWQRQNEALSALFAQPANEAVPPRLSAHRIARDRARARRETWPRVAAAAVLLLAIGGGLGWAGRNFVDPVPGEQDTLIDGAVAAHSLYVKEKRHAVEVAAADRDHLVGWLSNRVARPITPPDLADEGFNLVGGRLLPAEYSETGPAAQLMYENAGADRITVYITAAEAGQQPAYQFVKHDGLDAFYWANDRITCTVVGDLQDAQMKAVAKKIYQQLTLRPDPSVTGT